MMDGEISTTEAMSLLLMEHPDELRRLQREGFITPVGRDSWRLADLVRGFAKWAKEQATLTDSRTLARCWGVTAPRVSQFAAEGWLKPVGKRGRYSWFDACQGFVRWLRDEGRRTSKSASDSRMRDAKAHDIEVRTRQRLNRLVPIEIYDEMIDSMAGVVRSEFAGLAAVCTREMTMRRIIEREVNARLRRIAEHALAQAIRLEALGGADDAVRADRAGPVGGGEPDLSSNGGGAGAA
jgi:C4-dicarboxylate-specific signal transduction histidine kinase